MTQMLASVMSIAEAQIVLNAGVDIIDLKDPNQGALGALPISTVQDIVQFINGKTLVSATIGDLPMQPSLIAQKVNDMAQTGVDIVKVGLFGHQHHAEVLHALKPFIDQGVKIVLVLFADEQPDLNLKKFEDLNLFGVMLDTMHKAGGSLLNHINYNDLQCFVHNADKINLKIGLAGSLNADDVNILIYLQPEFLGFRGALCEQYHRTNMLNAQHIMAIKKLLRKSNIFSANA